MKIVGKKDAPSALPPAPQPRAHTMTLMASLIARAGTPVPDGMPPADRGEPSLMGCEAARRDLWGSEVMRDLGLTLIPSLATEDIYAFGEDLETLRLEAEAILGNLDRISRCTSYTAESIRFRAENILAWVRLARSYDEENVGVYIG